MAIGVRGGVYFRLWRVWSVLFRMMAVCGSCVWKLPSDEGVSLRCINDGFGYWSDMYKDKGHRDRNSYSSFQNTDIAKGIASVSSPYLS